jgi:hypothetical protein
LPTPAGFAIGQISTHLPQRVQASHISAVRAAKALSKAVAVIRENPVPLDEWRILSARHRSG